MGVVEPEKEQEVPSLGRRGELAFGDYPRCAGQHGWMSPTPEEAAQFQVTSESGMEREGAGPGLLKGQPHFDHIYSRRQLGTFPGTVDHRAGGSVRENTCPAARTAGVLRARRILVQTGAEWVPRGGRRLGRDCGLLRHFIITFILFERVKPASRLIPGRGAGDRNDD